MVLVMMICTSPERQEMVKIPSKFIATVGINSLEQVQYNPDIHSENMQVTGESTPDDQGADSPKAKSYHFNRRSIFSGQTKWCRILMVNFVNHLVEWTPMKSSVEKVVPSVLHDKEYRNLICHSPGRQKRN